MRRWTTWVPVLAAVTLLATWGRSDNPAAVAIGAVLLAAAVLSAVHHAEVVAHRVGEPFGSLILAVAVTIIEVALIVTLSISGDDGATLARDTVFAAVMITCNGIVGLSVLIGSLKQSTVRFNPEGAGAALACVATVTTTCLVLPAFTTSEPGPVYSGAQLAFAGVVTFAVYVVFVATQTIRNRDFFLPVDSTGATINEQHADMPSDRMTVLSLGLLLLALAAVVGLAKVESPALESAVSWAGMPQSFVGVIIAILVLAPEMIAAANAARRDRLQISLNLGLGSAMASVGLTIPVVAVASIWMPGSLHLGLGSTQLVLLVLTIVVATLTVVPGRATRLQGLLHLVLLAAFMFLAIVP